MSRYIFVVDLVAARNHRGGYKTYFHEQFELFFQITGRIICKLDTSFVHRHGNYVAIIVSNNNSVCEKSVDQDRINEIRSNKWNDLGDFLFNIRSWM